MKECRRHGQSSSNVSFGLFELLNEEGMKYTDTVYNQMIEKYKKIASDFKTEVKARRAVLDPVNNMDDFDEWELSQEEITELFEKFKSVMGLESDFGFFRDNDEEYGRYSEHMDAVTLPLCIGCYNESKIVEHMTHELYHALQYYAISRYLFNESFWLYNYYSNNYSLRNSLICVWKRIPGDCNQDSICKQNSKEKNIKNIVTFYI